MFNIYKTYRKIKSEMRESTKWSPMKGKTF